MRFGAFLRRPADLRVGRRDPDHAGRRRGLFRPAGRAVPRDRAADHPGERKLSRRLGRGRQRDRGHAARAGDQRRREHALHGQPGDRRRPAVAVDNLRARHRSRHRPGAGPEPRRDRRAAAARGGPPDRRHGTQELARPDDGDPPQLAGRLARPALHLELRDPADPGRAGPARRRRRRARVRRAQLLDADLARSRQGRRARPDRGRRGRGAPRPERAGRLGRARPAADPGPGRLPAQRRDPRSPEGRQGIREHRGQDRAGRPGHPPARHRAGRARRPGLQRQRLPRPAPGGGAADLPAARLERARDRGSPVRDHGRAVQELPLGPALRRRLQPDRVHRPVGRGGDPHDLRGGDPGRPGGDPVPADLARLDHPDRRHPDLADRHLRGDGGVRLLAQQPVAVRPGAGDRHRGRRRDRRGRERRAQPRAGHDAQGSGAPHDRRGRQRPGRDRARARRRVHPGRLHQRHLGPVLPPVRGDHRRRDRDLLPGLAEPEPGALRAAAQAAPGRDRAKAAAAASGPRLLRRLQLAVRPAVARLRQPHWAPGATRRDRARGLRRPDRAHRLAVPARADRLHPGAGSGLSDHRDPAAARRLARPDRRGRAPGGRDRARHARRSSRRAVRRLRRCHLHQCAQCRRDLHATDTIRRARGRRPLGRPHPGRAVAAATAPSRRPSSSSSSHPPCAASAPAAASR